jgi:hypothetical protein
MGSAGALTGSAVTWANGGAIHAGKSRTFIAEAMVRVGSNGYHGADLSMPCPSGIARISSSLPIDNHITAHNLPPTCRSGRALRCWPSTPPPR